MSTLVIRRPVRSTWPTDVFYAPFDSARAAVPAVALERDGEDGVLTVAAPGLDPSQDLSVQVTGDRLTVAGTHREVAGRTRRETRFSRSVVLPEGVTAEAVTARYEAGVLRVRVAGLFPAPVVPQTVSVAISSDVVSSAAATEGSEGSEDGQQDTAEGQAA